ncbi:response regulator [Chloroflexota bacterium]
MIRRKNKTRSVLVIEDEVDVLRFASRVLELEGYVILEAGDGERGLALARSGKVDLILLDLILPKRDGWSVLAELKTDATFSKIPVVIFTASAETQQREKVFSMGAADCLVKPLSAARLRETVARILRGER